MPAAWERRRPPRPPGHAGHRYGQAGRAEVTGGWERGTALRMGPTAIGFKNQ